MSKLKDLILSEYESGNVVILTSDGAKGMQLSEFINQPTDGMLYDLAKNEATILSDISNPIWINNYATAKTIRALKTRIAELEQQLSDIVK